MSPLERAVLNTLIWFDLWQQPLTVFECWYWLWDDGGEVPNQTLLDVWQALESLKKKNLVLEHTGFWQLADSPPLNKERLMRTRWSIARRQRATKAAKIIDFLPWIKMVALVNTLATDSAKSDSDIDLLIIVKQGRLFLSRFLITSLIQVLGWRRHGQLINKRICLSFYLADDHLNIQDLSYQDDPYLVYWLASLQPLVDKNIFPKFILANSWAFKLLPNRLKVLDKNYTNKGEPSNTADEKLGNSLGNMLEYLACRWQLSLIKKHKNSRLNDGTSAVVVTNSVLKFHESDQRPYLAARFRARQQEILAKNNL